MAATRGAAAETHYSLEVLRERQDVSFFRQRRSEAAGRMGPDTCPLTPLVPPRGPAAVRVRGRRLRSRTSTIQRGETKIGVVGFSLPDTVDPTAFELCAPTEEHPLDTTAFPCVPVKAPDGKRS